MVVRIADFTSLFGAEIVGVALEERVRKHDRPTAERTLISIWLRLGHDHDVTLHGAGAGTGVVARSEPPERIDMTRYGHLEVADAEGRYGLETGRVARVWEVRARGVSVGVRWQLVGGADVTACFADDTWTIGGPADLMTWSEEHAGPLTFEPLYDEQAA